MEQSRCFLVGRGQFVPGGAAGAEEFARPRPDVWTGPDIHTYLQGIFTLVAFPSNFGGRCLWRKLGKNEVRTAVPSSDNWTGVGGQNARAGGGIARIWGIHNAVPSLSCPDSSMLWCLCSAEAEHETELIGRPAAAAVSCHTACLAPLMAFEWQLVACDRADAFVASL
ncbi:hypothetical protein AK812_SmicGene15495 [Symbiodinium microadriaticum]|uniref:Uncharacterized protein n=1 Tax=Symbiodinium microadriaticum TaxID=2951 RepID=A0A1Q9E2P7_SYMMI|nr:hypothetical protein AK812_SmicGene15495 [Symbiodinium microadriaticum]